MSIEAIFLFVVMAGFVIGGQALGNGQRRSRQQQSRDELKGRSDAGDEEIVWRSNVPGAPLHQLSPGARAQRFADMASFKSFD